MDEPPSLSTSESLQELRMKNKNLGLALFLSGLILPGAGQIYLRQFAKGIIIAIICLGAIIAGLTAYTQALFNVMSQNQIILTDSIITLSTLVTASNNSKILLSICALTALAGWAYGIIDILISFHKSSPEQSPS